MKLTNQQDKLDFSKGYKLGYAIAMEKSRSNGNSTFIDFRNDNSFHGIGARAGYRAANSILEERGQLKSSKFTSKKSYKAKQNQYKPIYLNYNFDERER